MNRFSSGEPLNGIEKGPDLYVDPLYNLIHGEFKVEVVQLPPILFHCKLYREEVTSELVEVIKYFKELMAIICKSAESSFPLILGGDCCTSNVASLMGLAKVYGEIFLVHFDAHGDYNTPDTTITGFLGGMGLAALTGEWKLIQKLMQNKYTLKKENLLILGCRDLDPNEKVLLRKSGIRITSTRELTSKRYIIRELMDELKIKNKKIHVHIDPDVLDPVNVNSMHYKVPNGLTLKKLTKIIQEILRKNHVVSFSINGLNPLESKAKEDALKIAKFIAETTSKII